MIHTEISRQIIMEIIHDFDTNATWLNLETSLFSQLSIDAIFK